ncbi:MAG: regulatory protein RecX [Selenomonadaceae bacterium]|nr:regulatory protein RecX [Selenomonadaceae bacterium]MBQ9497184.1 regulatory protein RecX [Selenomonadaceae bacterium]
MIKEKKSALQKATDLLARQEQSSALLRQKLLARKYDAAEVDDALAKLKQHNYLDDEEICRRQFEILYAEGKLSVRQIVVKLIQRGFEKNFIEQLIPEDSDEHERLAAEKLLEKKFSRGKNFDRAKAWQFLTMRGFDGEIIFAVVENFLNG